jgi:hypothetical protein
MKYYSHLNRHRRMQAMKGPVRLAVSAVFALVGLGLTSASWAVFLPNGEPYFTPTGVLSPGGQQVQIVAGYSCSSGETSLLRVRVSQVTEASGNGRTTTNCTGNVQQSPVTIVLKSDRPAFTSGPAEVCGTQIILQQGQVVDALTWCQDIPLVPAP